MEKIKSYINWYNALCKTDEGQNVLRGKCERELVLLYERSVRKNTLKTK